MNTDGILKTNCPHCDGPIEYPETTVGQGIHCPHCSVRFNLPGESRAVVAAAAMPASAEPVKPPNVARSINAIGALQIFVGLCLVLFGFVDRGPWAVQGVALLISGVFTMAFAKLIECAHETAQRLARIELLFNERR